VSTEKAPVIPPPVRPATTAAELSVYCARGSNTTHTYLLLISNFRPVLNVAFFLLGDLPKERTQHTYLLPPWSRVLLEKLTGLQLVRKFPAFYET
jgi:hypothetical protein